jgi:hypothetical protein
MEILVSWILRLNGVATQEIQAGREARVVRHRKD